MSSRCTRFNGAFETHTASSVTTCQSGVPPTRNTATGLIDDNSRFTPGVLTPSFAGGLGRLVCGCARASAPQQYRIPADLNKGSLLLHRFTRSPSHPKGTPAEP